MSIILTQWMNSKVLLAVLIAYALAGYAAPSPAKLYSDLERHLQSLKALEVTYEADGTAMQEGAVSGRMVWVRPDNFLNETPEWTLGETHHGQWRYLKTQNTLILESKQNEERWSPESILFDLSKSFRPESVEEQGDGTLVLMLRSSDANVPGDVSLEFPPESKVPVELQFRLADGTVTTYRITAWKENQKYDDALFTAPEVPQENIIDFRTPGQK